MRVFRLIKTEFKDSQICINLSLLLMSVRSMRTDVNYKREDEEVETKQRVLDEEKYYKEMVQDDREESVNWSLQDEQYYEKQDQFSSKFNF